MFFSILYVSMHDYKIIMYIFSLAFSGIILYIKNQGTTAASQLLQ